MQRKSLDARFAESPSPSTSYFFVRLAKNSYQAVANFLSWGKDFYYFITRQEDYILSELHQRAKDKNITWITFAPAVIAKLTNGALPHRMYVITGPRSNVLTVAEYGEHKNHEDPVSHAPFDFTAKIFGRDTLINQVGHEATSEKGRFKKQLNHLDLAVDVARKRFTKLMADWNPAISYQNQMTYLGANIMGECILGVPELSMEWIPGIRNVSKALFEPTSRHKVKESAEFLTRLNATLLRQPGFAKTMSESKFIADDLDYSIVQAEKDPEIAKRLESDNAFKASYIALKREEFDKNPDALFQRLLERRGLSVYFAEGNFTAAIMFGIVYINTHDGVKERLVEELAKYRSENQLTSNKEIPREVLHSKLPYLDAVFYETLRLSSSAPLVVRQTSIASTMKIEDEKKNLNVHKIPAHSMLFVPLRSMHHDKRIWGENSLEFDPSRFEVDAQPVPQSLNVDSVDEAKIQSAKDRRARVLAFSAGKRQCPAQNGFVELAAKAAWVASLDYTFTFKEKFESIPTGQARTYWKKEYFATVSQEVEQKKSPRNR